MTTIDLPPVDTDADAELARRLERLAARRPSPSPTLPPTRPAVPTASTGKGAGAGAGAGAGGKRKRRHAAKRSRMAALALSLAATGGLATAFSFTDSPTSSQVMASGGIVSAAGATPVANGGVATTQPTVVNGDVFTNRFGPVQVQATFNADGSIASVNTIQTPDGDGKSIRINDRAVPTLNSEALAAQTARVDTVSGATYTSRGYEQSLQSAIDAARAAGITQVA